MEKQAVKIVNEIELRLRGCREKDLRFFRIDEYIRNIRRLDEFEETCEGCRALQKETEASLVYIRKAVDSPGKNRAALDRLMAKLARHMTRHHHFFPPYYHKYLHSALGLAIGSLAGVLVVLSIPGNPWEFVMAGALVGIIAGQVTGGSKDRVIRAENRLM